MGTTGGDQGLGVRAGRDDDAFALVEELGREGHVPIMSPGRPHVHDVSGGHREGEEVGRHHGADGVATRVGGHGSAATVA